MALGRSRVRRGWALALALAVVGVACTSGGDDRAAPPSSTATSLIEGGTLRLGIGGDLVVDPVEASLASSSDQMVLDLLHDGLTRLDAAGEPRPALASAWRSNDAQTAFRFTLRPDAKFTSGRSITPADVIASWERVMAAGERSLSALALEAVTGFGPFVRKEAAHVVGLSAPDAHTVRVELSTPLAVLPVVLASPIFGVVDATSVAGDDLGALDLSGAWSVTAATSDRVALGRRPTAAGHLDAIELRPFADGGVAYDAFETGTVDWAPVPTSRFQQAIRDHGGDAFAPFQAEVFFGLNVKSPNLGKTAFRQAIVAAIDREAIVEEIYPDLADPLATLVPAGIEGADPPECDGCTFDPEAAAAKVKAAYPKGDVPVVHIDFDTSEDQQGMAELVAADLKAVGIPTKLRPKSRDDYERFVVSGDQELFSFGWIGAYRSPDAFLAPVFGSVANDNVTGYGSPQVDLLLAGARQSDEAARLAELWTRAETLILDDAAVVPIAQFRTQVVVAGRVRGLVHAVDGTVDWAAVQVTG